MTSKETFLHLRDDFTLRDFFGNLRIMAFVFFERAWVRFESFQAATLMWFSAEHDFIGEQHYCTNPFYLKKGRQWTGTYERFFCYVHR